MDFIKANPVLSPGHPPGFTTGGKAPANPMTKTNLTLLEIACKFSHLSFEDHELDVIDPVGKLMQMQECGFSEAYRGDMYDANGKLIAGNLLIEIERSGGATDVPTVVIGSVPYRTQDFREITSDTMTGPGGWYVIVRSTEGGEE